MSTDVQTNGVVKVADAASGENVVERTTVNKTQKTKDKKVKTSFELTLEKARSIYRTQIDRSPETKKAAIKQAIGKLKGVEYTLENFLPEFLKKIYRLLDSIRFRKDCESLGMDVTSVAEHVAFTGLKRTYDVLDNGLRSEFFNHLSEMKEPIFTLEELQPYDTENLLSGQQQILGNGQVPGTPRNNAE